jgi:hypothetical protein
MKRTVRTNAIYGDTYNTIPDVIIKHSTAQSRQQTFSPTAANTPVKSLRITVS